MLVFTCISRVVIIIIIVCNVAPGGAYTVLHLNQHPYVGNWTKGSMLTRPFSVLPFRVHFPFQIPTFRFCVDILFSVCLHRRPIASSEIRQLAYATNPRNKNSTHIPTEAFCRMCGCSRGIPPSAAAAHVLTATNLVLTPHSMLHQ